MTTDGTIMLARENHKEGHYLASISAALIALVEVQQEILAEHRKANAILAEYAEDKEMDFISDLSLLGSVWGGDCGVEDAG